MFDAAYQFFQRAQRKLMYGSLAERKCFLGSNAQIHFSCHFEKPENIYIGSNVRINANSMLIAPPSERLPRDYQLKLGDSSYIGHNCYIDSHGGFIHAEGELGLGPFCALYGHGGITFGKKVIVGPRSTFMAGNHVFSDPDIPIADQGETYKGITLEDDIWVGAHCLILDGVTIGRHSVIAGGSVVKDDVPPFTLVAGVPANIIRDISKKDIKD